MNMRFPTPVVLTTGLLAALITGACSKPQVHPPRPPATVQTTLSVKTNALLEIKAFGNTEAYASVDIVPQVSGVLLQTYVEHGAMVTNGQPLFLIDPDDYSNRVQQAGGAVAVARANLDLARITVERNRPLLEKQLISSEDFDTIQARLTAAQGQLDADEAALAQARLNLERCAITSPLTGVCSERYIDRGNLVNAGQARLINIRSYDPIYFTFSVSEQDFPAIRSAMAAGPVDLEVTPRGETNSYRGTLQSIDNSVSTDSGTIRLRGQAANPGLTLWAGQFIDVCIQAGTVQNAVMVPEGAVQFGKRGTFVFVVSTNETADIRMVETGIRNGDQIQVRGNVQPDERVVVLGQLMLYPGAPVREADAQPPTPGAGDKTAPIQDRK